MSQNKFSEDTISLLQECNAGCIMAIDSMEQVMSSTHDEKLKEIIKKHNEEHIKIKEECHVLLNSVGKEEKEPGVIAKTMSKMQSEVKMMVKDETAEAAKILSEGCSMGMRSLSKSINQYKNADSESKSIAEKLYRNEEQMVEELRSFL